ncbi:MAG TPA: acyl-CoA dehydrogenase family protein, partial [Novosphingobium sp.]|nr:acyl-CoA dehydrogenase family protein [Novosphingobium sp.]
MMNIHTASNAELETRLIERTRALIPVLQARARASEAACSLAAETVADFREAGLFRILQPRSAGGYGLSPHVLCKVVFEAGRGDMSAAWVLFVLALHQ